MEEAFRALLQGSAAVTAHLPARAIHWGAHPQGMGLPALVITLISEAEGLTMMGPDGLSEARLQVDCYALTARGAKDLSRAVRQVLHGYRGGGFRLITHVASRDSRSGTTNEAERPFRSSLDFITAWRAEHA